MKLWKTENSFKVSCTCVVPCARAKSKMWGHIQGSVWFVKTGLNGEMKSKFFCLVCFLRWAFNGVDDRVFGLGILLIGPNCLHGQ